MGKDKKKKTCKWEQQKQEESQQFRNIVIIKSK